MHRSVESDSVARVNTRRKIKENLFGALPHGIHSISSIDTLIENFEKFNLNNSLRRLKTTAWQESNKATESVYDISLCGASSIASFRQGWSSIKCTLP